MAEPLVTIFELSAGCLCLGGPIIPAVYNELPEFRESGTLTQATMRMVEATEQLDRFEITVTLDGELIGFACIVEDDDLHVGRCLSLQWQYVVPEYRGRIGPMFLRALFGIGRNRGFHVVAYSHRINQGHYAIKYRRIKHGQND